MFPRVSKSWRPTLRRAKANIMSFNGLADLARLAGVSVSTVSRALAGKSVVSSATRDRIVRLAQDHGIQINQVARNLRLGRTGAIAVVLPLGHEIEQHLSDPFFMSLLGPIADALTERGYDLLLRRIVPSDGEWLESLLGDGRVDGAIVIGQSDQIDIIERAAGKFPALVVWGAHVPGYDHLVVGTDNIAGGRMAAERLLALGRRRLAFFGNPDIPEFGARQAGFAQAIAEARHAVPGVVLPVHLTLESSYAAICDYLKSRPDVDGIFAASDVIAMSALRALAEAGYSVPGDVAVVGYDDLTIAAQTSPPLTTVRQDVRHGGTLLVDLLLARLAGEATASVAIVPDLIERGSA